jgi:hypothetical protein
VSKGISSDGFGHRKPRRYKYSHKGTGEEKKRSLLQISATSSALLDDKSSVRETEEGLCVGSTRWACRFCSRSLSSKDGMRVRRMRMTSMAAVGVWTRIGDGHISGPGRGQDTPQLHRLSPYAFSEQMTTPWRDAVCTLTSRYEDNKLLLPIAFLS